MKLLFFTAFSLLQFLQFQNAQAAARNSDSYSVPIEAFDMTGARVSSASYSIDNEAGSVGNIGSGAGILAKGGYIGQLYDIVGLTISASPASLAEDATRQLEAAHLLDDSSLLTLNPATVTWSIDSGPLSSISSTGLATAAAVYQTTAAIARGTTASYTGTLSLVVLNTQPDNYGAYAGDGIDDDWQVQYFGLNNPNAAPSVDAEGDGRTNLQEFVEGTVPTDAASRFQLRIAQVAGQLGQKALILSPRLPDRTYTPQFLTNPATENWATLTGTGQNDSGPERTIVDLNATGAKKLYRIQITKP